MYASYGLNSRTQLSWPPIIHRLTFLITIQGRRNVKNFDGNKPINGQDLLTLPFMGKKLVGTSPPTSSYVPAPLTIPKKCITLNISLHISWLLKVYRSVLTIFFFSMMATHKFKKEWTNLFILFWSTVSFHAFLLLISSSVKFIITGCLFNSALQFRIGEIAEFFEVKNKECRHFQKCA